jgi:predicted dehydrogenase
MINVGIIGCGYWGPNLVRNFSNLEGCKLVAAGDQNPKRLEAVKHFCSDMETTTSAQEILQDPEIDAVVIATPISTHFDLAREALANRKHVFIEKPMTASVAQAQELVRLSDLYQKVLMVDHTFIYTGAVQKLKLLIDSGELGDIYYYDSVRVNLGLFQPDANVLWDLAPHDFALMTYLLNKEPVSISAVGSSPVRWDGWKQESIAYISVKFEDNTMAHFHVNWLSPVKLRRTLIGGSRKMVIYDHLDSDNQLKIYDKGIQIQEHHDRYHALVQYRMGDLLVPKVDQTEALSVACKHFIECIETGRRPMTDGHAGLRVVQLLEAAQLSMRSREENSRIWIADEKAVYANA